ncbi:MAG: D-aminoacylase [Bacillota bacterium]|nr:MAG: D-aminoacylase [Bacillota bacterium]
MDLVLRNGTVIDGTGTPSRPGDVVVSGDRVVAVSPAGKGEAVQGAASAVEVDCSGLIVCPGFIDIHSHSDISVFLYPSAMNYVAQGVTLLLSGNCGFSGAPIDTSRPDVVALLGRDERVLKAITWRTFSEYLATLDNLPKAVNVALLVGHGNIRVAALGPTDRQPGPGELEAMKAVVREAMRAGACGLSTGLIYAPGVFATTEEIVELAKVAAAYGGIYATHVRNESDLLLDAVLEAIRIGRESGARVEVAHHKASGRRNWGLVRTSLALMDYHRRLGTEITCDVYPCTAGATGLEAFFPPWAHRDGRAGFEAALKDEASRGRMRSELSRPQTGWQNLLFDATPAGVRVTWSPVFPQHVGRTLDEIARETASDVYETMMDLALEDPDLSVTVEGMSEDDVRYVISHRLSMIASDAAVVVPGEGLPHPRTYRAFTRVLATYARDEGVLTVERAIHKMTGMPAWKLGLADRGVLRPGAKADLAVFDLWGLGYDSRFGDSHHLSEGMVHVLVNGRWVIRDGRPTGDLPGEVVRRP